MLARQLPACSYSPIKRSGCSQSRVPFRAAHPTAGCTAPSASRATNSVSLLARCAPSSSSTTTASPVSARLTGQAAEAWAGALSQVQGALNLEQQAAEKLLERAFGWGSQAFWRGSKVEEVPGSSQVSDVLTFLGGLGLSGNDLTKVVKAFPEVLACSVPEQLQVSVNKLQGEWRLQGDVLTRALVRQPQVLGYSLDCEGSCIGECNRCWARF